MNTKLFTITKFHEYVPILKAAGNIKTGDPKEERPTDEAKL
jgi:hypothetical protein